jgi:hypothetical protein
VWRMDLLTGDREQIAQMLRAVPSASLKRKSSFNARKTQFPFLVGAV